MSAPAMMTSPTKRHPLLAAYLTALALHPLRTRALTLGTTAFLQEVLSSHLAHTPAQLPGKRASPLLHALARAKVDLKALKMFVYGFLVSAPLGHLLLSLQQRAFAGRTGARAKFAQILSSNLIIAPIQVTAYLASLAVINGATSANTVLATIKQGLLPILRIQWVTSPMALLFAQRYLSPELWVPFFTFIQFATGTFLNTKVKQMQLAKAKSKQRAEDAKQE